MITENAIKTVFIMDRLRSGSEETYRLQRETFGKLLKSKTGRSVRALSSPSFTITATGKTFQVVASLTKQLRFQDMGVRVLYTKPLFSALKKTYGSLRYGLTDEIKEKAGQQLLKAMEAE